MLKTLLEKPDDDIKSILKPKFNLNETQLNKLNKSKKENRGSRLELKFEQIKQGGFLPLHFTGIGTASEVGILNLNNSNQEGSHWVEWIKHENLNIYFESYDYANPPKELRVKDNDALFTLASTTAAIPAVGKVIIEDFNITIPPVEYQEMYKIKLIKELTKLSQGNNYRKRKSHSIDDLWAADLVLMKNYGDENSGYLYMLNIIDIFSKFTWSESLMKKDCKNVTKGLEEIIKRVKLQKHNSSTALPITSH
ncbi:Ribonuclease H-like domain [Cinara cedri]|uniref:Ribonuclease H-like domain n=1 Tax=Cinara cedri TaxID=506608 RepID=A0A5E4NMI4_9HEMI|nr:Ribonuclease H-like domain [Cinara cedri]